MPDEQHREEIHLPEPSAQPIITAFGTAMMIIGLVPDSRLWRLAFVSMGFTIAAIGLWLWVQSAIEEYRNLPDE
jgi:hypothetical protein